MRLLAPISLACTLLLGAALAAPKETKTADWPQWRGPGRDAVSTETGLVRAWPESGPKIVWRAKAGAGYSGVSVADGRLFTMWDEGDKQFLVGLDAATGTELWRQPLGAAFSNPYGDGPRSTPLVDEGLVYAIGTSGLLVAADRKTGVPKWQHDLVAEYAAALPPYGYSSSPLAVDGLVVVEAGGKGTAFLAFEKKTGKLAWSTSDDRPAYSSPIAVTLGGVPQIVFWSANGLHAVAADRGAVLWSYPWEALCPVSGDPLNTTTPVFLPPDRVFIASSSGAASLRIARVDGVFRVETLWKSELLRSDVNTPLALGDHLYGFDRGILTSIDTATGSVRWQTRGFERGSLIAADGTLIVLGENGTLALVDATPEAFRQRASADVLKGRSWTAPSLAAGRLYLRNHEELVCIDLRG